MTLMYGRPEDIDAWMALVAEVAPTFPGLETPEQLAEHRASCGLSDAEMPSVSERTRRFAACCCPLAGIIKSAAWGVSSAYRRRGVASMLLTEALARLDRSQMITVSTFRENNPRGTAPRALYRKFGFVAGELTVEFGYPNQTFLLYPQ
ncbi:MAG: GNAT family N-acetyltransferase [Clostridiales bacterium]|nr:GNAT family N-acetyltransferase [Clostridiales bacterium]